jgi:hypothetical protein
MARPITCPLQAPTAWKKRAAISCSMLCAAAHASEAATKMPKPASSTGRRP